MLYLLVSTIKVSQLSDTVSPNIAITLAIGCLVVLNNSLLTVLINLPAFQGLMRDISISGVNISQPSATSCAISVCLDMVQHYFFLTLTN